MSDPAMTDHAELARLISDLRDSRTVWDNASPRPKEIETQAADGLEALLAEIAALRGGQPHRLTLSDGSEAWCSSAAWRWFQDWALRIEELDDRATQAERQRDDDRAENDVITDQQNAFIRKLSGQVDEAVGLLAPFAEAADNLDERSRDHDHIWEQPAAMNIDAGNLRAARTFLASIKGDPQ